MTRLMVCLCACLFSCGGSAKPAESAPDPDYPAESTGDSAAPEKEATEAPAKTDGEGAQVATSAGEATKDDVQAVLQLVIEDQELTPFLHLDRPDRFPLKIAGNFPPGLELTKATKPVEIVDAAAAEGKKKPVIVFTEIDVQPMRASVRYRYDIEGVKGACTLEKREGHWVLAKSRITER